MNLIKEQENLNQKKVLLRLDLNVPIKNGIITDQTRIDKILPIINFLIKKKSKIIVISHIGRPKGKVIKDLKMFEGYNNGYVELKKYMFKRNNETVCKISSE